MEIEEEPAESWREVVRKGKYKNEAAKIFEYYPKVTFLVVVDSRALKWVVEVLKDVLNGKDDLHYKKKSKQQQTNQLQNWYGFVAKRLCNISATDQKCC
ncbi:hypothetical protein Scep_025816 [Stephania cephalantha]|uniref:Uncharacterized protein n=1 Tax=Stephania cephalantha TaxID=152367 RepID=A0AAP0HRI8_9MAGN